jgi:hypothetical protein
MCPRVKCIQTRRFTDFNTDLVVLNKLGRDNIQILNPYDSYNTVNEFSLKTNSNSGPNPNSAVLSGNSEYFISLYDSKNLIVFDPVGNEITSYIDLSSYAYNENIPCAASLYYDETSATLFVSIQRLDRTTFLPSDYSSVLAIDTVSKTVIAEYILEKEGRTFTNPYSKFRYVFSSAINGTLNGKRLLLVSTVGEFQLTGDGNPDGGVIALILTDDGSVETLEPLMLETELYGDIVDFILIDAIIYAVTLTVDQESYFISYNVENQTYTEHLHNTGEGTYLWAPRN